MKALLYCLLSLGVAAGLLSPDVAHAALITFEVCVDAETDFADAGMGDKLTANENPALGILVRFTDASNDNTDVYMDWSGADKGCNDNIQLETTEGPFTVKVIRRAQVNGNFIEVRPSTTGGIYYSTELTNFTPVPATIVLSTGPSDRLNILMAASFAMAQSNGGVTSKTFPFFDQGCSGGSGSCERYPEEGIYIDDPDHKRVIVHELGHALADAANGDLEDANNESADLDDCSDAYTVGVHKMNSKEFSSNAFVEGFAHFYSALAFNDFGHNDDCELWKDGIDWNINGVLNTDLLSPDLEDPSHFSCDVGFDADPESIPEFDLLDWYCLDSGQSNNRALEYDFLRAMWDLVTYYDYSPETVFDIWVAAGPHSWTTTGNGTGGSYPSQRMSEAAYDVGGSTLQDDYDENADYNGIWR